MNNKLLFKFKDLVYKSKGMATQLVKLKNKVKQGLKTNKNLLALFGKIISFTTNFTASANGCKNPKIPTTLGPRLLCIAAIAFLSANVKNATTINSGSSVKTLYKIKSK
jgi:hypothetical protein